LGKIGGERVVTPLIEVLRDEDEVEDVRVSAADALGKIGGERAMAALIDVLNDKYNDVLWGIRSTVRRSLAEAVGKIGAERVVALLIQALKDEDEAEDVRVSAASALGEISGERVVAPLIEALMYDVGDSHWIAAEALEQIEFEFLAKGLRSAISHTNSFVRRKTAEVISYYSNSHEELKLLAETDLVPEVRQAAERSLTRLESKKKYFGQDS
jgi:HEAT repeat protein